MQTRCTCSGIQILSRLPQLMAAQVGFPVRRRTASAVSIPSVSASSSVASSRRTAAPLMPADSSFLDWSPRALRPSLR